MKKYISYVLSALLIATLLVSPIIPFQGATTVAQAATIKIKASQTTLEEGSTTTLKITGTTKKVKWTTSNSKAVKVDSKGKVTAVKKGTATITATISSKKYTIKMTVIEPTILSSSTLVLNVGKKDFINVTGKQTGKVNKAEWTSSNKKIATVTNTGIITAVKAGSTVITASIHGKKYTCKVTVNEKIAISNSSLSLKQGESKDLTFKGIKYRAVWSSSDTKVAYVSYNGKVTAVGNGTATITGRVDGTNYTCKVTVSKISGITQSSSLVYVGDKKTKLPSPIAAPTTTPSPTETPIPVEVVWTSSNNAIVSVGNDGTLAAKAVGNVIITATVGDVKYTYFVVSVNKANPFLKNSTFTGVDQTFDKLHFVAPKSWLVDSTVVDGMYAATIQESEYSGSSITVQIKKTSKSAADYYTSKNKFIKEEQMTPATLISIYNELFGKNSVSGIKQINYMTSNGNAFLTDYTLNYMGMKLKQSIYFYAIGQYEIMFMINDMGDTANFKKTAQTIINSVYIQ